MLATIRFKAQDFFTKGHERTIKAKKNIAFSFLLKGVSIAIGFIIIPMTINYVNPTNYGIWLTLSSIITWFNFFDIGLGNGLKNKLAEANAKDDNEQARIYISTTYAVLSIISIIIFGGFYLLNKFIDWGTVLNSSDSLGLNKLALIVVGLFCLQFVMQIINTILTALHAPFKVSFINVIGQICSLIVLFVITQRTNGSLLDLVLIVSALPLLIQLIASFYFFNTSYKSYKPCLELINLKKAKNLLRVGSVFFFIQIGALILFQTDNIVITQLFGPKEVTTFNISYKLFSIITMVFTIIMTPFWSAYTDAYAKQDIDWIKKTLSKTTRYWMFLSICAIILLFFSEILYRIWLKDTVKIPFSLSAALCMYVIGYCWLMLNCYVLNGIGKVRLQLHLYIITAIVNIPLAIFLGKTLGILGVPLSNFILLIVLGVIFKIQCKRLLNNTAFGIWNQ